MSNNSSTEAGWLNPLGEDPAYDEALDRRLSLWMRSVSGLPEGMARPRWQKDQPPMLPVETTWGAFGVVGWSSDDTPAFVQQDDNTQMWRHEDLVCMASFYGPSGMVYAARFRDGIEVEQNNAELKTLNLSVVSHGEITPFPELINNQWVRRYDLLVTLRRKVVREYGIKTIVDASVQFFGEK
ncbi:phage neck terminator protein [Leminorella grimontii]|uniref:phage neck terminator protein n=1 Tax=Leminorella grimontii TaxID=82981 RepID=UPI0032206307